MKNLFLTLTLCFITAFCFAQQPTNKVKPVVLKDQIVETACGVCKLGLNGKECELAVKINGKSYFVDGTSIKDHGDAHDKDGFCNAVRKAKVSGSIVNGRFKSTSFALLKAEEAKPKTSK